MAEKLARILKTDIMADLPLTALAQVVQKAGRGRDTVLAHITPKEAKMLKARGGRGSINPKTGLPEFEDGFEPYTGDVGMVEPSYVEPGLQPNAQMPTVQQELGAVPQYDVGGGLAAAPMQFQYTGPSGPVEAGVPAQQFGGYQTGAYQPALSPAPPPEFQSALAGAPPEKPEVGGILAEGGFVDRNKALLAALGLGGAGLVYGRAQQGKAARQAQAQRQELESLAAPYRAAGGEALSRAQRGELTATGQQAFQAAQARLAQGVQQRGGVGQQQAATQLEQYRQQLLATQAQFGLNLSNIADNIVRGAIQTQLQADQAASQATGQFYTMLGQALGPTALKALG